MRIVAELAVNSTPIAFNPKGERNALTCTRTYVLAMKKASDFVRQVTRLFDFISLANIIRLYQIEG